MFGGQVITWSVAQGSAVLLVVLAMDALALHRGLPEGQTRALTFATFFVANIGLIFNNRSWSRDAGSASLKDATLWSVTAAAICLLGFIIYVPVLAQLFRFAPLGPLDLTLSFSAGLSSVAWFGIVKRARRAGSPTATSR
jgi:Ca2+-transporting ATPase